jgi:uncharacterized protein YcaQ
LNTLQQQLRVLPVAISEAGAWKYAFVYDLTHRYYPELPDKARNINETQAVDHLVWLYVKAMGMATIKEIASFLGLTLFSLNNSLDRLRNGGILLNDICLENSVLNFFCIPELFD